VPPANTSPPTIAGAAEQGRTLRAAPGSWSGAPTSFSYRWQRCSGSPLVCATVLVSVSDGNGWPEARYILTGLDVGKRIQVVVDAVNADGTTALHRCRR
jgi:hypothetical protein